MGLYDASLGARSNETSGKAILARQREGDVGTFHYVDNLSRAIKYAGKVLIDLIPHVYSQPRVMRVMGYDESVTEVRINDPEADQIHDLTVGKYDLTVEAGPSFTTQREEAVTQMTEMVRAYPDAAPIIGDLIAKNMDWPGADEIAKRLKVLLPPQIQALEKMDGLPPEAQAAIAQAQNQIQQLTQYIEQGKQLLAEKDSELSALNLDKHNREAEINARIMEADKRFQADMAKVQAQLQIAAAKENQADRQMILENIMDALKQRLEGVQESTQESGKEIWQAIQANNEALMALGNMMTEPKNKTISIMAPSGAVYEGTVNEGEMAIQTPSGETYSGKVTEH